MSKKIPVVVGVLVVVAGVFVVLMFPAWSAARGDDARWVVQSGATKVLDHDDRRILVVDGESLRVLDRETGEESPGGRVDHQERAALVPDGVVASAGGRLALTGADRRVVWETTGALVAVDLDAGVAVAALSPAGNDGPSTLTGHALADGSPVWTMPDVARVGPQGGDSDPVRPPGALRSTTLVPVIRVGGYPPGTAAVPATWSLVSTATGEVVTEVVEEENAGRPVAVGDVALRSEEPACADLTIIGGPEVRWPDGPPAGECDLVWGLDPERALLTAWADQRATRGGDDPVTLYALAVRTGEITEIDWTGGYADTMVDASGGDLARSWGRYLFSRGVVHDTQSGAVRWRAHQVWSAGDTAVVAEPVSGLDGLASGGGEWVRLADAATGEPTEGGYIAHRITDVEVLDRGQALVMTGDEVALIG